MNTIKFYIFLIPISIFLFGGSHLNQSTIENDFSYFMNNSDQKIIDNSQKNSQLLPSILSGLIPGVGQIYSGRYKRGAIFLSIELIALEQRRKYNNIANDYVQQYKSFANEHWSFDKWIRDATIFSSNTHPVYLTMLNNDGVFKYPWENSHHIEYMLNGNTYRTDERLSENIWVFGQLYAEKCPAAYDNPNVSPNEVVGCETDYFDDAVVLNDHHFYEGISKYDMFFAGWDDTEECDDSNQEENCSWVFSSNNDIVAMSSNKYYYQYQLRDKANKNFDYAENALSIIFINHAFSFFDSFINDFVKNRDSTFNYYTTPIYDYNNKNIFKGINLSILW